MNPSPRELSHVEVLRQRAEIRKGLWRVHTAVFAIVTVVIGLALAAVFAAYRAGERADEAREARDRAQQDLWKSYLAQAMANRFSAAMGRKAIGEEVVAAAARIRPSLELRSEAIAQMALTDLREMQEEPIPETNGMVAVAPASGRCAVAHRDGLVEVLTLPERRPVFSCTRSNVAGICFSPGEKFVGLFLRGIGFEVLESSGGASLFRTPPIRAFDFSGNDQVLAGVTDEHSIHFYESGSGKELGEPLTITAEIRDIALDATGERVAVNGGQTLQIWSRTRGLLVESPRSDCDLVTLGWSDHFVAVGDELGGVQVWDLRSRRQRHWQAHQMLVDNVFFNHKGDLLVSDSWDGSCKLWDPNSGGLILETRKGFATAFSPDDSRLSYTTKSSRRAAWGWWKVSTPRGYRVADCSDGTGQNVWNVDFSADGKLAAIFKDDGLRLMSVPAFEQLAVVPMRRSRAAFFVDDGKSLLTCGDYHLSLWPVKNTAARNPPVELGEPKHISLPVTTHVDGGQVNFGRTHVALPLSDSEAALFDLKTLGPPVLFTNADYPKDPAISPDAKWVVTGTFHGRGSVLWDAASGKKLLDLDDGNCSPVFSPDGQLLVLAGDKEYKIFETGSWKLRKRIPSGTAIDLPNQAAFSRDGRLLAIIKERRLVQLLDPQTATVLASLAAPDSHLIQGVCFNWDGTQVAAIAGEAIQLWDLTAIHAELARLGLDWDECHPEIVQAMTGAISSHRSAVSFGSTQMIVLAGTAVGFVVFCAWTVLRRQRRLFQSYEHIDGVVEQRNRELEVAQAELMHSQKMKALGTLAAGIAHDVNNLLSVIRMSNKLIGREVKDNPEAEENVAEVEKAVQQGKHIVASMLGYSKEKIDMSGTVSLPELVEDSVGLLSRQFLSGITLDLQLDRDSPPVAVARARLEQILLNLIVNAAEAMNGKGRLRIEVNSCVAPITKCEVRPPNPAPKYVELLVADSGCGIHPDVRSRIFEPMFTTKVRGASRGTGLGLSMVYTMAEQDGLGIGLSSEPGKGATFRIIIPVQATSASTRNPEESH